MNRSDFLRIMEGTHPAGRQMAGEINELIALFPYFQSAHMLLLKALRDSSDIRFESQLKRSAIYIADREVLYHLLKDKPPAYTETFPGEDNLTSAPPDEVIVTDSPSGEVSADASPYEEEEKIAEPEEQAETFTPQEEIPSPAVGENIEFEGVDNQQTVIESARNSEDLISEIERESGETTRNEVPADIDHLFSRPILISAESNDEKEEWGNAIFVIEDESLPREEKVIYMDPGFSVAEQFDLLELESNLVNGGEDKIETDEESLTEEHVPSNEEISSDIEKKQLVRQMHEELIDKFIQANPRIEPSRERSDQPPEDIAKPYTESQGGFVTETLARIYVNQGYYTKAIEIYEKLSLKFPEKSDYFAAQIEKVKELIK